MTRDSSAGLLGRLYARLGIGYFALVLVRLGFLALGGGFVLVVVATRLLARSFRPPLDLVLLVEAGIALGCGVPFALMWRDVRPLAKWIRDNRPPQASAAWQAGVTVIRRALPRCFGLVSVLLIPAVGWAVRHYHLGASGFLIGWIFTQLGIAVTAVYMFFVGEAMLRPMVEDAARVMSLAGGGVSRPLVRIRQKVVLALAVTTGFAVLVSQAIGSIGHSPASRMLGAVAIAALVALTFTPVLIRVVTDSVVGPVRALTSGAQRAAAGDLGQLVLVTSDDELGVLATSFNHLIRGLREREMLREDNIELTAALHASLGDLQRRAEELRASRARVVVAADSERRRVERDLHDGAQQQLVLVALKLAMAGRLVEQDPPAVAALLEELRGDLYRALSELRDLARGIYPAVLEHEGLRGALREAVERTAIPSKLQCVRAGRYPPELEAAVYFCCLEALQNAAKHAGQDARVMINLTEADHHLVFKVADTGQGYDTTAVRAGAGLQNMADRMGALGGKLAIRSVPGSGTTISGYIPLQT